MTLKVSIAFEFDCSSLGPQIRTITMEETPKPVHHVTSSRGVDELIQEDDLINVASRSAGSRMLFVTDEWFAAADRLLLDEEPVFDENAYNKFGKTMDGWESRRRRTTGHDWCLIQLAQPALVTKVEIDTGFFTGNHVPHVAMEAVELTKAQVLSVLKDLPLSHERLLNNHVDFYQGHAMRPQEIKDAEAHLQKLPWKPVLSSDLQPGYRETRYHSYSVSPVPASHLKLSTFPDGGIARLRVYGTPILKTADPVLPVQYGVPIDSAALLPSQLMELPQLSLNGRGLECSNQHYGVPQNLLQAPPGVDMGDGWETARHRDRPRILQDKDGLIEFEQSDYCTLELGTPGVVRAVIVDTRFFKGNFPESIRIDDQDGRPIVPRSKLGPHAEHLFDDMTNVDVVSQLRVTIFPDGGISRLRVYGEPVE